MNRNYYGITIGPITDTLELSSKPLGLWLASYMFSELSYQICEELTKRKGVQILSPYFDKVARNAIGKYHDRIIFKSNENLDLESITQQAKNDIVKKLGIQLDVSYFYCKWIKVSEVELQAASSGNVIGYLGAKLDALELEREYFDANYISKLRELLGNNDEIKKSCLFKKCEKSLNADVHLIECNGKGVRDLKDICDGKYYAILQADGDGVGKLLLSLKDCQQINKFSKVLFDYAEEVSKLIKNYNGSLIYAGGDDILAIVPLWGSKGTNVLELCQQINMKLIDRMQNFIADNGIDNSFIEKISTSFGISIYYHKFPLYEAFKRSIDQLFGEAKKHKNCIAIYAQKHSGQYFEVLIDNLNDATYIDLLNNSIHQSSVESNASYIYHLIREKELFEFALSKSLSGNSKEAKEAKEAIENLFTNYFDNVNQISNQDLQSNIEFVKKLIQLSKSDDKLLDGIIQTIRFRKFLQEVKKMTTKWYRVDLKPLEFYYFAKEVGSRVRGAGAVPYYVISDEVPSQTTLLGVMRYYILRRNNELNSNAAATNSLIGPESFDYKFLGTQSFGQIKSLTSLIIKHDGTEEIIIPCPMNLVKRGEKIVVYKKNNRDVKAKEDSRLDYIGINGSNTKFYSNEELFDSTPKTRNNKQEDEDALFKIEMKKLKKDYSFSFYIEMSEEFEWKNSKEIVYLGSNKSAFTIELEPVDDSVYNVYNTEVEKIKAKLSELIEEECWYAMSDVYIDQKKNTDMTLSKIKGQRNLKSKANQIASSGSRYDYSDLVTMYKAGSIFYEDPTTWNTQANAKNIGLNNILEIKRVGVF